MFSDHDETSPSIAAVSAPSVYSVSVCVAQRHLTWLKLRRVSDMPARQRLRSASTAALDVPVTRRSTIADRSFSVAAARVWNSLPANVTSAPSLLVFRRLLKTELWRRSFSDN